MFASPIDVPTIVRLAEFERIVGIKDSSGDVAFMLRMMDAVKPLRPEFAFLTGWEPTLVPLLVMGADGGTHATSGVAPELTRQIYDLVVAGELEQARTLQSRLLVLFDAMLTALDFPEGFRVGIERRGFRMGKSRQPLTDSQRRARTELAQQLGGLLAELGCGP